MTGFFLILQDFIYFQKNRRSMKCPQISKTWTVIIVIFIVVGVIAAMALLFGGGGYSGEKTSKGKAPKG